MKKMGTSGRVSTRELPVSPGEASETSRAIRAAALGVVLAAGAGAAEAASHGKAVYGRTCVACHGSDGKGALPGMRALGGKKGSLGKPDDALVKSILEGYQAPGAPVAMPPKGGDPSLTGQDAIAVLRYMREAFGR
ncbi:cytochrome C [Sulfurifustis variabilis]|uniref:Cytochrome C n=1 Tax=Sulfurifustis variabilis TaxID=1675686 RepID=A0A1C7AEY6_9GAMM|nr:cytochrome c [Sulfurifustis variabilis]BAU49762.1 cytochrome C [Sulfurifustis variabilis]